MRLQAIAGIADPLAQIERADQRRNTRRDVDHRAAGEIERRNAAAEVRIQEAALAPDHMRHRKVHEQRPERHEQQHGAEFHPLRERAGNQRRGDDGEHQLVNHKGLMRNRARVVCIRRAADAVQEQVSKIADERRSLAKRQAVTHHAPNNRHQSHHDEALHHGGEHVLLAHQPAVKQRQTRSGHHQDQGGADQHPGVVAGALSGFGGGFQSGQFFFDGRGRLGSNLGKGGRGQ